MGEGDDFSTGLSRLFNPNLLQARTRMSTQMLDAAALLNEKEAARLLSMSYRTLQSWRSTGEGPTYLKLGRSIRYRKGDLLKWIDDKQRTSFKPPF
jgi:predicted DNA-binding transcriptional regulator AlpA